MSSYNNTHPQSGNTLTNTAANVVHNITDPTHSHHNTTGLGTHNNTGLGLGNNNATGFGSNTTTPMGLGNNTATGFGHNTTTPMGTTGFGNNATTPMGATGFGNNATGLGNNTATGFGNNTTGLGTNNTLSGFDDPLLAADKLKNSVFQVGPAGPHNVVTSILRDHAEFRRLYNDFVQSGSTRQREEIRNEMIRGLSIHDFITETILFPAAAKEIPHGPEMIAPFKTRMTDFRKMLLTINSSKLDHPTFLPSFHSMFQELDASMKQKEMELLPALSRALTPKQMEELGKALDKARSGAPTRPHTSAATSNVLGHLAAPIDKLKDKARDFAGASAETKDVLGK